MAILTANGHGVVRGALSLPRAGVWHADLDVDAPAPLTGAVTLKADGLSFQGTVVRGDLYMGVARIRVAGGAGGLGRQARPQHYVHPQLRSPLADLLRAAGETLSPTVAPALLARQLTAWTVLAAPIGEQLSVLVARAAGTGVTWRVLADGTVWLGVDAWPDAGIADWRELGRSPSDGSLELGLDGVVLLPGTTLGDLRIDYCEHLLEDGELRTRAWVAAA